MVLTDVIQKTPAVETTRMRISRRPRFIEGNLLGKRETKGQSHNSCCYHVTRGGENNPKIHAQLSEIEVDS